MAFHSWAIEEVGWPTKCSQNKIVKQQNSVRVISCMHDFARTMKGKKWNYFNNLSTTNGSFRATATDYFRNRL